MLTLDDNTEVRAAFLLFRGCWSWKDGRNWNMNLGEELGVGL